MTVRAANTGHASGVVDPHGEALARERDLQVGGIVERQVEREGGVAGHPTHRECIAAVGIDLELEHLVVQAEQRGRVVAGLGVHVEHEDAAGIAEQAELRRRADHAVGDVAVGLAGADGEAAGQHRARQGDDDQVVDAEVVGTADDAARLCLSDVDRAPLDGLAVLLRLVLGAQHATHDERAFEAGAGGVDLLELEVEGGEAGGELFGVDLIGQVDQLAQPGDGYAH